MSLSRGSSGLRRILITILSVVTSLCVSEEAVLLGTVTSPELFAHFQKMGCECYNVIMLSSVTLAGDAGVYNCADIGISASAVVSMSSNVRV